jgi:hypothetical protein
MSSTVQSLLAIGIAAAKDNAKAQARRYLNKALASYPTLEQTIKAYMWLSQISDTPEERREYLETLLALDPNNPIAHRGLAILDGRLKPEDIIDPDNFSVPTPMQPQQVQSRQFTCSQCSGRMVYNPQGKLICEYCERHASSSPGAQEDETIEEKNFILTLATAKGHSHPVTHHCLHCRGCGASFILTPELLSATCPYCASTHAIEQGESKELMPPEAIIPYTVDKDTAHRASIQWLKAKRLKSLRQTSPLTGLYIPVWTFDVSCDILIEYEVEDHPDAPPRKVRSNHIYAFDDILIPAGYTLPESMNEELECYHMAGLVPYDSKYIAGWFAETYQTNVSDASLAARKRAMERSKRRLRTGGTVPSYRVIYPKLAVQSYKLILLPLWIAHYRDDQKSYTLIVNGQTGAVRGEKPRQGFVDWLFSLADG